MNTYQIGDSLEEKIFDLLSREIQEDRFYLRSSSCKIFRKKGYYSSSREKEIIFDVSIEVYLPSAPVYSMLILVECKNYTHPVPVNDVEEFWAKIEQVGVCNTKGVLATNAAFQVSALSVAKSKGIGYLRYFEDSQHKWELYRSPSASARPPSVYAPEDILAGLRNENFYSVVYDLYMLSPSGPTNALWDFIEDLVRETNLNPKEIGLISNDRSRQRSHVPFKEKYQLEEISFNVLNSIGYSFGEVKLEDLCAIEFERSGLLVLLNQQHSVETEASHLGQISFENLEIKIFTHSNPARERFTLAHELGHYFLGHGEYLRQEFCEESDFSLNRSELSNGSGISRMEFQANYFAASLLMPQKNFLSDFRKLTNALAINDRGHGQLYVDDQPCNIQTYEILTNHLMQHYGVSRAAVTIRLTSLGVLNDKRK